MRIWKLATKSDDMAEREYQDHLYSTLSSSIKIAVVRSFQDRAHARRETRFIVNLLPKITKDGIAELDIEVIYGETSQELNINDLTRSKKSAIKEVQKIIGIPPNIRVLQDKSLFPKYRPFK